jgi:hypothetical protein
MRDEFSVYWWDEAGTQHEELRLVRAEEAVKAAKRLTEGLAAQAGGVRRVIITDGEGHCNYSAMGVSPGMAANDRGTMMIATQKLEDVLLSARR